jgi:fucose permease
MTIRHKLLVPSAYLSIGMCGVYLSMYQISLLQIAQAHSLGSLMMGMLVAIQYIGLCLPPLFLGSLSEKLGKRGVITISIPLMVIGAFLVSAFSSLAMFIIGIFIIGAGYSVTEATFSATLGAEFPGKSKLHLGVSQAIFSLGAVLSPFACEALFGIGKTYRDLFLYVSIIYLFLYIFFLFTKQENDIKGSSHYGIRAAAALFKSKTFIFFAAAMFLYVGIEEIIAFFTDSYFELTLQSPSFSALALSIFWVAMIPSRLLMGVSKLSHKTIALICAFGIAAGSAAVVVFPSITVKLIFYGAAGFFSGPMWPLVMDIVAVRYPQKVGLASNVMMSVCGLGGAMMPLLVGALIVGADFTPVFITAAISAFGIVVSFVRAGRSKARQQG